MDAGFIYKNLNIDYAKEKIISVLGVSRKEFEKLNRELYSIAKTNKVSEYDILTSTLLFAKKGLHNKDIINGVKSVLLLQGKFKFSNSELPYFSEQLLFIMRGFGLDFEYAQNIVSDIIMVTTFSALRFETIIEIAKYVSPVSTNLGVKFKDVLHHAKVLADSGVIYPPMTTSIEACLKKYYLGEFPNNEYYNKVKRLLDYEK